MRNQHIDFFCNILSCIYLSEKDQKSIKKELNNGGFDGKTHCFHYLAKH